MRYPFILRRADPMDAAAVEALLQATYPRLMQAGYSAEVLKLALPLITRANSELLKSGTFQIAETAEGMIIGCGGWSPARPDDPNRSVDPNLGHVRHFAVHPDWNRMGVGRAVFTVCANQARDRQIRQFDCLASLVAQRFYEALGFVSLGFTTVQLSPGVNFPVVRMTCQLSGRPEPRRR